MSSVGTKLTFVKRTASVTARQRRLLAREEEQSYSKQTVVVSPLSMRTATKKGTLPIVKLNITMILVLTVFILSATNSL